jgi:acyl-coenzyme A thioesterase PaaI-like protein
MTNTAPANRLATIVAQLARVPAPLRTTARSLLLGRVVKFVGTAGLSIEELTDSRAVVSVKNRARVQNHISGVHAAAMALIAETATGFIVGMNVPDSRVPVIKSMHIDFVRRAKGSLRAVAELDEAQRQLILSTEKGEVTPKVTVTDEAGEEPIRCTMIWAWTPKRK